MLFPLRTEVTFDCVGASFWRCPVPELTQYRIELWTSGRKVSTVESEGPTPKVAFARSAIAKDHPERYAGWKYIDNADGSARYIDPANVTNFVDLLPDFSGDPDYGGDVVETTEFVYRAISQKTAEWIGNAASVAGGYVAVEGPRLFSHSLAVDPNFFDVEDCRLGFLNGDLLVMRVPADAGLATEGRAIPEHVLRELRPQLASAGYAIDS